MDFTQIAGGFCLIEAPRWDGNQLWFTDILQGGFRCLRPDGQVDSWLAERKTIGGLALNADGSVICSGTGGIVWLNPETGASGTLLDLIEGVPISGVNDIFPDGKGGLFLGTVDHVSMLSGKDFMGKSALYHLNPDGTATELHGGMLFSNGIGLSPDGRHVYIVDSGAGPYVTEIFPDGGFGKTTLLCELPGIDGLTVDAEGCLWGALIQTDEIARILPDGTVEQRIPAPAGHPVSLCFGGPDYCDLFVTSAAPGAGEAALDRSKVDSVPRTAGIYRARSERAGLPSGRTAFKLEAR